MDHSKPLKTKRAHVAESDSNRLKKICKTANVEPILVPCDVISNFEDLDVEKKQFFALQSLVHSLTPRLSERILLSAILNGEFRYLDDVDTVGHLNILAKNK